MARERAASPPGSTRRSMSASLPAAARRAAEPKAGSRTRRTLLLLALTAGACGKMGFSATRFCDWDEDCPEGRTCLACCQCDDGVIAGTAADTPCHKVRDDLAKACRRDGHVGDVEGGLKEVAYHRRRRAMWRPQTGQDSVCLEGSGPREPRSRRDDIARGSVSFMPGSEGGDNHAGVHRDHRRARSSVSRTSAAVNTGRSRSGTATSTPARGAHRC